MTAPRVYADFNKLDDDDRLILACAGTFKDLQRQGLELQDGLGLTFYMDDGDDEGRPDDLLVDGSVAYNPEQDCWLGVADWSTVRHASEEVSPGYQAEVAAPTGTTANGSESDRPHELPCTQQPGDGST